MKGLAVYPPLFNQLTCEYTVQTLAGDFTFTKSAGLLCDGKLCDVLSEAYPGWITCGWNIKSYGWNGTLRYEAARPLRKLK